MVAARRVIGSNCLCYQRQRERTSLITGQVSCSLDRPIQITREQRPTCRCRIVRKMWRSRSSVVRRPVISCSALAASCRSASRNSSEIAWLDADNASVARDRAPRARPRAARRAGCWSRAADRALARRCPGRRVMRVDQRVEPLAGLRPTTRRSAATCSTCDRASTRPADRSC